MFWEIALCLKESGQPQDARKSRIDPIGWILRNRKLRQQCLYAGEVIATIVATLRMMWRCLTWEELFLPIKLGKRPWSTFNQLSTFDFILSGKLGKINIYDCDSICN